MRGDAPSEARRLASSASSASTSEPTIVVRPLRETHFRFEACLVGDRFLLTRFDEPLAALTFRARAARAFRRFFASFARASADYWRRFFTGAFLVVFFAALRAIFFLAAGARPTT